MTEQLVIAVHHRHRPFVASKRSDIDGHHSGPIEISCQHQMADRSDIVAAKRESLFDCCSQTRPTYAASELKQFDHLPCSMLATMTRVQRMPQLVEGLRPASSLAPLRQRR